jgi:hypothetical protein
MEHCGSELMVAWINMIRKAIVKSMPLHSRASADQKEPTDINALCDE